MRGHAKCLAQEAREGAHRGPPPGHMRRTTRCTPLLAAPHTAMHRHACPCAHTHQPNPATTAAQLPSPAGLPPPAGQLHQPVQLRIYARPLLYARVHHKVKQLPHSQRGHARAAEEIVDVQAVCGQGTRRQGRAGRGIRCSAGVGCGRCKPHGRRGDVPASVGMKERRARTAHTACGARRQPISSGSPSRRKSKARG